MAIKAKSLTTVPQYRKETSMHGRICCHFAPGNASVTEIVYLHFGRWSRQPLWQRHVVEGRQLGVEVVFHAVHTAKIWKRRRRRTLSGDETISTMYNQPYAKSENKAVVTKTFILLIRRCSLSGMPTMHTATITRRLNEADPTMVPVEDS